MSQNPERIIIFPSPTTGNSHLDVALEEWGIKLGASIEDIDLVGKGRPSYLTISPSPHVFYSQILVLTEQGNELLSMPSAMIMMGHGIAFDSDNENWRFLGTNKKVSDTVRVFEQVAEQLGWAPLDALIVCRKNLKPLETPKVRTIFETRGIPYILADDTVTVSRSITRSNRTSGIYRPMEGFELLVAEANYWNRVEINRWKNYWSHRLNIEDVRNIPNWAKYPAK